MIELRTKIKIIPETVQDLFLAGVGIFGLFMGLLLFPVGIYEGGWGLYLATFNLISGAWCVMMAYVFQDRSKPDGVDEYADTMRQIETVRDTLKAMNRFLEKEQQRVRKTEETVRQLSNEHESLAPMVRTRREDVDAILATHMSSIRRSAWKERFVGFGLGLLASTLAGGAFFWLQQFQFH